MQDIASDHQTMDFVLRDVRHTIGTDKLAVLEDRQIAAHGQDLSKVMRHETDRHALGLQLINNLEHRVHFPVVEIGCRLIEQESVRIGRDRARDLDAFQLAQIQSIDVGGYRNLHTNSVKGGLRQRRHLLSLQDSKRPGMAVKIADEDVLGDAQRAVDRDFLMNQRHALLHGIQGRLRRVGLAIQRHLATVRTNGAAQHAQKRGLARAVFADDGMNRTCAQRDRNISGRNGLSKPLVQTGRN